MHLLLGGVVSSLIGTAPSLALAQTAAAGDELQLEEVVITGTSIRGIAPVGSTPVQYVREDITTDAPASIGDVLSNIPQIASFGTEQQLSTTNRFRTAGLIPVIHNMEIGSTLTLFNGHRMASTGTEATFADPSMIPTIALERVEVVSDGNSAIYGSDAVAGVVNFLYRRNVEGFEASVSTTQDPNTSYSNMNYGALWGHKFDSGAEVMVAFERAEHDPALEGEFPFIKTGDHRDVGGRDLRPTTTCFDPLVTFSGTAYSGPSRAQGTTPCDPLNYQSIGFMGRRTSGLATVRFSPTNGVELWAEGNYTKYTEDRIQNWTNIDINVPRLVNGVANPYFWTPPGATATPATERVRMSPYNFVGSRTTRATTQVTGVTLGASFDVGTSWKTDVRMHYSKSDDYSDAKGLDTANLNTLTAAGQFNPFGTNSAAVIGQINNGYGTYNYGNNKLTELEVKADGPLFAIGGGDVKAAVGMNHRTEGLDQLQTAGCATTGCSFYLIQRNDHIDRGINSVFTELNIPVVGAANAKPGVQELTFSVAGRYDKYDLLKGVTTPKVAVNYKPIESLSVHGSWGKSFAAPNLGYTTNTFAIVQTGANIGGITFDIYNLGGGNAFLTPEKAKTYSFGLDWKPEFLAGFTAGASYYDVQYTNLVYKPSRDDVVFNSAFTSARILAAGYNPATAAAGSVAPAIDAATMAAVMAQYPPDRILAAGQTFSLVHRSYAINLGQRHFAGLDLNVRYDFDTSIGKWNVGVNANQQRIRKTQVVVGGPISDDIGTRVAPEWQISLRAGWNLAAIPLHLTWVSNYLSGYDDKAGVCLTFPSKCSIDSNLVHNFTVAYDFEKLFRGVTLQARVTNVTDKKPPYYDAVQGYDNQNASPYGRQYTVSATAKF